MCRISGSRVCTGTLDKLLDPSFFVAWVRASISAFGLKGAQPAFGSRPGIPLRNGRTDRTEIDMKLGDLLIEAKLTEVDFQKAPARMIERYRDIDEVFAFGTATACTSAAAYIVMICLDSN